VEEQNKIFLKKLNNNSIKNFIASLYDSGTVSAEDLEEIKRFIDDKMKGE
jgi:predicted transcriptional regulator